MDTKTYIPVELNALRDKKRLSNYLKEFKILDVKTIFLVLSRTEFLHNSYDLKFIDKCCDIFHKIGIDVGLWINTLGFGGAISEQDKDVCDSLTCIQDINSHVNNYDAFCPLDKDFQRITADAFKSLAGTKADRIMLDDELVLSIRPGLGCACEKHMQKYFELLGERIDDREKLLSLIVSGKPNKYRTVWMNLMGQTLKDYCAMIRQAVDSVNKNMRVGFCASFTSWDLEGVKATDLTKILAGNTKPFLRLSGAPYWKAIDRFGKENLQSIIEFTREQAEWSKDSDVEVFSEGDSYPRTRLIVPASDIEIYDLALRFSCDIGSFKYFFEYNDTLPYDNEDGYVIAHKNNAKLRNWIKSLPKANNVGIGIVDNCDLLKNATLPNNNTKKNFLEEVLHNGQNFLSCNTISTVYGKTDSPYLTFSNRADFVTKEHLENGLILDINSAKILTEKGIDVGLKKVFEKPMESIGREQFNGGETIAVNYFYLTDCYQIEVDEKAEILSNFIKLDDTKTPASYFYTNKDGYKFLVFAFDGKGLRNDDWLYCSYQRQREIMDAVKNKFDGNLYAEITKCPYLYQLAKQTDDKKGLFLFYANTGNDKIINPKITVDKKYTKVLSTTGKASIKDGVITVRGEIPACDCFGLEVYTD